MSIAHRQALHYPDQPLHQFLRDAADRHGDRVALRFGEDRVSFADLDAQGTRFANALLEIGFGIGQRAVLASANRPEWLMSQHGVSQSGGSSVLVNPSWKETELAHAFGITRPDAVIADLAMAQRLGESHLALPPIRICLDDGAPAGWRSFSELIAGAGYRRPPDLDVDLSRLEALLPFSSGTTGLPKAVRHSHRSLVAAALQRVTSYGISDTDRLQFFMPLFTIYGVIVATSVFASGASLRLFARFDPKAVLENLEEERITIAFGAAPVAIALRDQADLERYDLSSLRYMMWGATPVVAEVAQEVTRRSGIRWFVAYAITESGISANPIDRPDAWRLDSPGMPIPDVELRVVDGESFADLAPGETGELVVRSPSQMMGYLPEEADADVFLPGGWIRTGDIGWVEPEGWIHLTDRSKEMMKVRGFQVAPAEIEQVLFTHPAISDCAVYGVPDPRQGEAPRAAIVRIPGATVSAEEIITFVADRLATYKHLGSVVFVDEVPRNAGGKVLRRVLRAADAPTSI
jgi:acyl-CoA synthetase (AMP-forming)/AMP-acid ligase II